MTTQPSFPERTTWHVLRLGFAGRCPRCGVGRLFDGYLNVAEKCEVCELGLEGHDSGDGAVVPAMLLLGGLIVGAALVVEIRYEPPVWLHMVIWLPLATLLTLWILPRLKGMGIAIQHRVRSTDEPGQLGGV